MAKRRGKSSDISFMSYKGKAIWYSPVSDCYMVARGDGTDEYFSDWKDAMKWIDFKANKKIK